MHAYDHRSDVWKVLLLARFNPFAFVRFYRRWDLQAIELFNRALKRGGVFHVWGHSWEIDARGDWDRLERVCEYIAGRPSVRYLSNGELV